MPTSVGEAKIAIPPASRRGACPSLAAPMQTGDGLLVRLRPEQGALTVDQFMAVAKAAALYGNGVMEISARGSLQVRGLKPDTVAPFAARVEDAGISSPSGPAIEISPLHGLDPAERGDAGAMAERIKHYLADLLASPEIAPKLSIVIDGGGSFSLQNLQADIRISAYEPGCWQLAIAGSERTATVLEKGSSEQMVAATADVLRALIGLGPHRRARDLVIRNQTKKSLQQTVSEQKISPSSSCFTGLHRLAQDDWILGIRPRFGQIHADTLHAFLQRAAQMGCAEIRLAPDRHFIFTELSQDSGNSLAQIACDSGFSVDPADPSRVVAACPGAGACAAATFDTKALAAALLTSATPLLDGSLSLHLSGCFKGCAHPAPALTLSGQSAGIGVSLNGRAVDTADAILSGGEIAFAIERLSRHVEKERRAGESAAACLKRLGDKRALAALLQG